MNCIALSIVMPSLTVSSKFRRSGMITKSCKRNFPALTWERNTSIMSVAFRSDCNRHWPWLVLVVAKKAPSELRMLSGVAWLAGLAIYVRDISSMRSERVAAQTGLKPKGGRSSGRMAEAIPSRAEVRRRMNPAPRGADFSGRTAVMRMEQWGDPPYACTCGAGNPAGSRLSAGWTRWKAGPRPRMAAPQSHEFEKKAPLHLLEATGGLR
jgi:hypothetical protein